MHVTWVTWHGCFVKTGTVKTKTLTFLTNLYIQRWKVCWNWLFLWKFIIFKEKLCRNWHCHKGTSRSITICQMLTTNQTHYSVMCWNLYVEVNMYVIDGEGMRSYTTLLSSCFTAAIPETLSNWNMRKSCWLSRCYS